MEESTTPSYDTMFARETENREIDIEKKLREITQNLPKVNQDYLRGLQVTLDKERLLYLWDFTQQYPDYGFPGSKENPISTLYWVGAIKEAFLLAVLRNDTKGYVLGGESSSGAAIGVQIDYEKLAASMKDKATINLDSGYPLPQFANLFIDSLGHVHGNDKMLEEQMKVAAETLKLPLTYPSPSSAE